MRDLSVLIPARNERWLARTVEDVCAHKTANTEVIVVLDGAWPEPGYALNAHPDVKVIYLPEAIGQRAATNLAARVSRARYVMKLDGHCAVAPGFDAELIRTGEELGEDVTQIPAQYNLHVYDRICEKCGRREYQGSLTAKCETCGEQKWRQEVIWNPSTRRRTEAWSFDSDLRFQYGGYTAGAGDVVDVMSSLGACFFMSRERFWALGGLDEAHGSWGQFGVEIAAKSWLSGGRHVVNRRTWFSHMFRVGGMGYPYDLRADDQEAAREYSRDLWRGNRWAGQVRPLRWLVDKFWPVSGWSEQDRRALDRYSAAVHTGTTKGVVYYTDNQCSEPIAEAVRAQLERVAPGPIVAVSLKPIDWDAATRITLDAERGYLTMFQQILAGLEAIDTDVVYLCEHDVLYPAAHFVEGETPAPLTYVYNQHVWKVDASSGRALHYRCSQTSGLSARRELLVNHYRARVSRVAAHGFSRRNGFEPGTRQIRHGGFDDYGHATWLSSVPLVDVRHSNNLTPSRWSQDGFRNKKYCAGWTEGDAVPGWGVTRGRFDAFLAEHVPARQLVA